MEEKKGRNIHMKVYISVDIEGITGVTSWDETELGNDRHRIAAEQMKKETMAACRGALDAGATEIWVKDSHDSGRNMWGEDFPDEVKFVRGWMCSPDSMVAGIDESFDAALCVGYHSEGGVGCNPLAHTMSSQDLYWIKINGELVSELEFHTYVCAKYGVPMVFVSGDEGLCQKAERVIPGIRTVAAKIGVGNATVNRNPRLVCEDIRKTVKEALLAKHEETMPVNQKLVLEVCFRQHGAAKQAAYYPGAAQTDAFTVKYETDNISDMLIAFMFMH